MTTAEEAKAVIDADRRERMAELDGILRRESARLRCKLAVVIEKVSIADGVFADRAYINIIAE